MVDLRPGNTKVSSSALPSLNRSPKKNWVEKRGGLPKYIERVAKQMEAKGYPRSRAIRLAIGIIERWAVGKGGVGKDIQAQAAKALAQWEALKNSK